MSLFVVYNMTTTEVKAVYDNTSEELLDLFEKFCDFFRNTNVTNEGQGDQVEQPHSHTSQLVNFFLMNLLESLDQLKTNYGSALMRAQVLVPEGFFSLFPTFLPV